MLYVPLQFISTKSKEYHQHDHSNDSCYGSDHNLRGDYSKCM